MDDGERRELEAEQRHLDRTYAAYDTAVRLLRSRARTSGVDEFATEALERMRLERIRAYDEASGPVYFGRIDVADGRTLYVGRHAVADQHDRLLEIDERRVRGFVDELLRAGEDHLTEAIAQDIARQRVGEMRQIVSTITPEQYELISQDTPGALVIQGGPGTGKTAVGLHRAAWLLYANRDLGRQGVLVVGPNDTFIGYIAGVLPALGEGGVEQRPIGALVSRAHRDATESRALAALKGSARMAVVLERLLWDRVAVPSEDQTFEFG